MDKNRIGLLKGRVGVGLLSFGFFLAGCQDPRVALVLGPEKAPEQMGLQVDQKTRGFVRSGVLASYPQHLGRAYADQGSLVFRVATLKNIGREDAMVFPEVSVPEGEGAVETHLRFWMLMARDYAGEWVMNFGGTPLPLPPPPSESFSDFQAEFDIVDTRLVFQGGARSSLRPPRRRWEEGDLSGDRIRPGETVEIQVTLRLREGTPLIPSLPPPPGYGSEMAAIGFFPPNAVKKGMPDFWVESLVWTSIQSRIQLALTAVETGTGDLHPLFLSESRPESDLWVERQGWVRNLPGNDVPISSLRFVDKGLPILL